MSNRNIHLYLQDIIDSIYKIQDYSQGLNFDDFVKDNKTIDAVLRNISIIGEAIRYIPQNTRSKHPNIP